ncbi:MAG: CPBP family intramembrane metalloprotease [Candidatus Thermoplasmatota archaeon]|nr:CPBP family intramembrane metalloprotease [Candidatus Thermoplasmatota archaeon]
MDSQTQKEFDKELLPVILLFIALVIMLAGFIITELFFVYALNIQDKFFISGYWVFSAFAALLYILYFHKKGKLSFKDIGLTFKNAGNGAALGVIGGVVAGLAGWAFLFFIGVPAEPLPGSFVLLFFFVSVVSAPIREEIMVRGIIWAFVEKTTNIVVKYKNIQLGKRKKDAFVVIAVSLAFLFLHVGRGLDVLLTTILFSSFIDSIVYYKTRNLAAPMTAHAIYNLFVLLRPFVFAGI